MRSWLTRSGNRLVNPTNARIRAARKPVVSCRETKTPAPTHTPWGTNPIPGWEPIGWIEAKNIDG